MDEKGESKKGVRRGWRVCGIYLSVCHDAKLKSRGQSTGEVKCIQRIRDMPSYVYAMCDANHATQRLSLKI